MTHEISLVEPYRRVLTLPGALAFSAAGLVARMPLPMTGLGIVLLLQASTGRYEIGGSVSAVCTLAGAVMTVLQGRLIDRLGQRRVLPVGVTLYGAAMVLLIVGQVGHWPLAFAYLFAAVAGGAFPPVGSAVRARWSYVVDRGGDSSTLPTAFAVESINDEIVFLIGPLLCTFLATAWHSWSGVAVSAVLAVVGTAVFVAQTGTEPPVAAHHDDDGPRPPLRWGFLGPLLLVCVGLGVLFGAGEVATVGFASEHGHRDLAGVPLALWAFGSMISGIVVGAFHPRNTVARVKVGAAVLLVTTLPLPFVHTIPLMCVFMTLAGVAISPTIVASMSVAEQVLPLRRLTEGIAILFTGMIVGEAPSAALAGWVIDHHGASSAYWILVVATVLAVVVAQLLPRRLPAQA